MKNRLISVIGVTALVPSLPVVLPIATAHAHGYIATPASRQAQCAQGLVQSKAPRTSQLQPHTAYDPTWTLAATPALWKEA